MALTVQNIKTQAKTIIVAQLTASLGSAPIRLKFIYEVEKNDARVLRNGYGIRALGAIPSAASITQAITLDQDFEVILTDTVPNSSNDDQREDVVDKLFSSGEDISAEFINTRINIPLTVLKVSQPTFQLPEFLDGKKALVFRMLVTVTYRIALT